MLDIRVLKKMATWLLYLVAPFLAFMAAIWIGYNVFDVGPDTVVNYILGVFGICAFYQFAKFKVEMERDAEQRLIDKLRDTE